MTFLGDIVVVEHIGKNVESKLIFIPDDTKSKAGGIRAKVVAVGKVSPERRKKGRFYPQDYLTVGDTVIVPEHLGSRNRVPNNPLAIIYDGEDVVAKISG